MGWERPLTCEDFGMKPSDFHEIKESEIPKHTMTFDKHATGVATNHTKRHIPDGLHPSLTIHASDKFSVLPYLSRNDILVIYTNIFEAEGEHRLGDACDVYAWLSLKEYIEDYVTGVIDDDKQ